MRVQSITMVATRVLFLLILCFVAIFSSGLAEEQSDLWTDLGSENHFAILRHAIAPGIGDPSGMKLDDCTTQRNLSDEGLNQAERIGQRFKAHGYTEARVFTSQWCRCIDTARQLALGKVQELPILNSFFASYDKKDEQTQQLRHWLGAQDLSGIVILVSHQVNITALTGVYPQSGELVIVERKGSGDLAVKGTLLTD